MDRPERGDRQGITIVDVAREAGVSIRTVSRVLNREKYVSEDKRKHVQAVIDRLRFVPNAVARALPGAKSYTLGLIFQKLSANYISDIQFAAVEACHRFGYHLVVEQLEPDMIANREAAAAALAALRLDAAILLPPACDQDVLLDALDVTGLKYTRIAPTLAMERSPAITLDDERATMEMVRHLVELGHERIGFIVGNASHASAHKRLQAFWSAIDKLGLDRSNALVQEGDYSHESGLAAAELMLADAHPPSAIFASNDAMAAGVIAAAGRRGILTPRDLSVCGFDDSPISRYIWPPLTTIRQPLAEMARAAVEQLLDSRHKQRIVSFDFELLTRESTSVPRSR